MKDLGDVSNFFIDRQADVCNALCCKAMQQYVIWQQPVLHFMHCYDNHITTKSQCGVRCTKINIPIPYLVYASPTPGRKSWHIIMKQKSQSHETNFNPPQKTPKPKARQNLSRNFIGKFKENTLKISRKINL